MDFRKKFIFPKVSLGLFLWVHCRIYQNLLCSVIFHWHVLESPGHPLYIVCYKYKWKPKRFIQKIIRSIKSFQNHIVYVCSVMLMLLSSSMLVKEAWYRVINMWPDYIVYLAILVRTNISDINKWFNSVRDRIILIHLSEYAVSWVWFVGLILLNI